MSGHLFIDSKTYKTKYLPKPENSYSLKNLGYSYFLLKSHPMRISKPRVLHVNYSLMSHSSFLICLLWQILPETWGSQEQGWDSSVQGPWLLPPVRYFPIYSLVKLGCRWFMWLYQNDNINVCYAVQCSTLWSSYYLHTVNKCGHIIIYIWQLRKLLLGSGWVGVQLRSSDFQIIHVFYPTVPHFPPAGKNILKYICCSRGSVLASWFMYHYYEEESR